MKNKKVLLIIFVAIAIVQLAIPGSLVYQQENVLATGKIFKFRTQPVDPYDPFRGKYITLNFRENQFPVSDRKKWENEKDVYVIVKNDSAGYASIQDVVKEKPQFGMDYFEASVHYFSYAEPMVLMLDYPFNRFYMEESKATVAEIKYNEWQRDSTIVTYAKVRIKNGTAALEDVMVNEVSIQEKVKEEPAKK